MSDLDVRKPPGPDGFIPRVLKECGGELCSPIGAIIQNSINTGQVPDDRRKAQVTPIYKKGSKTEAGNGKQASAAKL